MTMANKRHSFSFKKQMIAKLSKYNFTVYGECKSTWNAAKILGVESIDHCKKDEEVSPD